MARSTALAFRIGKTKAGVGLAFRIDFNSGFQASMPLPETAFWRYIERVRRVVFVSR